MARILYGVHGTAHGHAIRALTIARHFSRHEFLFVTHDRGAEVLRPEYPVVECPVAETVFRSHRVALGATLWRHLRTWRQPRRLLGRVLDLVDRFQPDVCLSDYDYFVPRAARLTGLPCLSLDHQHIITFCRHPVPRAQWPSYWLTGLIVRRLYSQASDFLVTSFFRPPLKEKAPGKIIPPFLREPVLAREPSPGEHVLVYQAYPPFPGFISFLKGLKRPVVAYGFEGNGAGGNIIFKEKSEEGFLDDLASSSYVICGGSHNLISEALFYGKPVLSFPIRHAFEQFLNAFYLERLGYGRTVADFRPGPGLISAFEEDLERFRTNIARENFCGNEEAFRLVGRFIREKML